jgi:hypothetical protein
MSFLWDLTVMIRLALHCPEGRSGEAARGDISYAPPDLLARQPFQLPEYQRHTIIKSTCLRLNVPEVLSLN